MPLRSPMRRLRLPIAGSLLTSLLVSTSFFLPAPILAATPTPVAEWKFDEGSGATANDAIGNLDGTLSSGATWVTSGAPQGAGALAFDGTLNGLVTVANGAALEPGGDFTIALWAKSSDVDNTAQHTILQKGTYDCDRVGSYGIGQLSSSAAYSVSVAGYGAPVIDVDVHANVWDGQWRRVVGTYRASGEMDVWVDGYPVKVPLPTPGSADYGASGRLSTALLLGISRPKVEKARTGLGRRVRIGNHSTERSTTCGSTDPH